MDAASRVTADDRLRALERRWRETGDRADEGALLLERVRLGLLDRAKLELAAFCAHEGARRALDERAWPPDLPTTIAGLERWGLEAVLSAKRAMLEAVLDLQLLWVPRPSDEALALGRELLEAHATFQACPCDSHWAAGHRLQFRAARAFTDDRPALRMIAHESIPVRGSSTERLARETASCSRALRDALDSVDAPTLLRHVRAALIELALGA